MLLPNVSKLEISVSSSKSKFLALFLQDTVRDVIINITCNEVVFKSFSKEVKFRLTSVESLDIRMDTSVLPIEDDLTKVLATLVHLRRIFLPQYSLTSTVFSTLARLPLLVAINNSPCSPIHRAEHHSDLERFSPVFRAGTFPVLEEISLHASFFNIAHLFQCSHAPKNLTHLRLHTTIIESPLNFRTLLFTLATVCPKLTSLDTNLMVESRSLVLSDLEHQDIAKRLTIEDIKLVVGFPLLTKFQLFHHHPLEVSDDEIIELATRWSTVEVLKLNPDPVSTQEPSLSPATVLTVLRLCPRLTTLGLHVDFTSSLIPVSRDLDFDIDASQLRYLFLGTSPIDVPNPTAMFLSAICGPTCAIITEASWLMAVRDIPENLMEHFEKRWKTWDMVRCMMETLIEVRAQANAKRRELEMKLAELQRLLEVSVDIRFLRY